MSFTAPQNTGEENGLPARRAAYDIVNQILFQKRNMDDAFTACTGLDALPPRDRAFTRLLVSLILKRAPEMDRALAALLHEPISTLKPPQLVNIFRLGIAQFVFLKTPAHAAVNTTVELAEAEGIVHHKPLVNAVMRRLTREGLEPLPPREAGRVATPEWLWHEWVNDYGVELALDIAAANLEEGAVDVTVKRDPEGWAEKLNGTLMPSGSIRLSGGGFIPDLPGFAEGEWWIQGAAAALPAKLFGDLQGKTVIDLCAAPGGKTAQLAAMGATVTALDRSAMRVKRLDENMARLGFTVETVIADGATWQPKERADAVLLDAPCSATGTIRHQPDVLRLKDIRDQEKLAALQRRLLVNALDMLKPGGTLVYCTCSLQKAEGESQTTWLLQQALPVQLASITAGEIGGMEEMLCARGDVRCLPQHFAGYGGSDGFYIARFRRNA
ncbi:MAG TPA: RsmB/NOP family class I SAM-dependent RNA methyltransferase [Patescibacteria group bacterium]|nr:RsmB/NOP family class I SAM-dependent RNA methyltransferase [Patescibacteria group bacterium]